MINHYPNILPMCCDFFLWSCFFIILFPFYFLQSQSVNTYGSPILPLSDRHQNVQFAACPFCQAQQPLYLFALHLEQCAKQLQLINQTYSPTNGMFNPD